MNRKCLWFSLLLVFFFFGCIQNVPVSRKQVRTWVRGDGCFVKRIVYPCYNRQGNLKIQKVRCPDGRRHQRRWIHPDTRCEAAYGQQSGEPRRSTGIWNSGEP